MTAQFIELRKTALKRNLRCRNPKRDRLLRETSVFAVFAVFILIFSLIPTDAFSYNVTYDSNGNLEKDFFYSYEYNGLNQLVKIRDANSNRVVSEYLYGHDGERIKKIVYGLDGNSTTNYYASKDFIREVNSSGSYDEVYYYDDIALVAKKDSGNNMQFYHPNHLGSTEVITDSGGNVVREISYAPFGAVISGENDVRFSFTGKEKDEESGLMYYGARYYDPLVMMRFTQPDTVIQDIYDPQSLNRYSYARNNPVKYTDPTGHFFDVLLDVAFIIWDVVDIVRNPFDASNYAALGLDVAGAFIPFATGLGKGYKSLKSANKAADARKAISNAGKAKNAANTISSAKKTYESFKSGEEALRYFDKVPAFQKTAKNLKAAENVGGTFKAKSMDEGKALMDKVFPSYKQVDSFSGPVSQAPKMEKGTFRIDEIGDMAGHANSVHTDVSHINILTEKGAKIAIVVEDIAKWT